MEATVHVGPKGGVEFRLWTGENTFRVVSRYQARPFLSPDELAKADAMLAARASKRNAKSDNDTVWRNIMRGSTG